LSARIERGRPIGSGPSKRTNVALAGDRTNYFDVELVFFVPDFFEAVVFLSGIRGILYLTVNPCRPQRQRSA